VVLLSGAGQIKILKTSVLQGEAGAQGPDGERGPTGKEVRTF